MAPDFRMSNTHRFGVLHPGNVFSFDVEHLSGFCRRASANWTCNEMIICSCWDVEYQVDSVEEASLDGYLRGCPDLSYASYMQKSVIC